MITGWRETAPNEKKRSEEKELQTNPKLEEDPHGLVT